MTKKNTFKGDKPGPGRPKGSPNKVTTAVREIAQSIVNDETYRKNLISRMRSGSIMPGVETMLWHYAYGKPTEKLDVRVGNLAEQIGLARMRASAAVTEAQDRSMLTGPDDDS